MNPPTAPTPEKEPVDENLRRLNSAISFLNGQEYRCLGIDREDGHSYRDEMVYSLSAVASALASKPVEGEAGELAERLRECVASRLPWASSLEQRAAKETVMAEVADLITAQSTTISARDRLLQSIDNFLDDSGIAKEHPFNPDQPNAPREAHAWGSEEGDAGNSEYHAKWGRVCRAALERRET